MVATYTPSSRYKVSDTNQSATRVKLAKSTYRTHRVRAGDTMDTIASQVFGDFNRWWEIADMNPHVKFPLDLKVGEVLRIPL